MLRSHHRLLCRTRLSSTWRPQRDVRCLMFSARVLAATIDSAPGSDQMCHILLSFLTGSLILQEHSRVGGPHCFSCGLNLAASEVSRRRCRTLLSRFSRQCTRRSAIEACCPQNLRAALPTGRFGTTLGIWTETAAAATARSPSLGVKLHPACTQQTQSSNKTMSWDCL